ncbi:unnamed protein product [Didymodactylos carnosus]|uniref:Uncharacterized protein n=1 Tax=Didymodactylos carnosus TaxID=1234261 RepID=A0A814KMS5_9BILA|nr:unnamed protein product [Didymodactylos carnosus]CAF1053107.1 unnamed protein product [Didymodactylos carnosus]CAF3620931.1 unnamed protein product [Didymodactylos carnosus]CAF3822448.1 unnamed protein product [Didymodactylos carnosus]
MTVIPDVFNDKLNYSCKTFADMVRLNEEMHAVVQKYELFGDSDKARKETWKFLDNFKMIEANLKQINESLLGEKSKLEDLKKKLNDINGQFENLVNENKSVSFLEDNVPKGLVTCYWCGMKPTTMNYYKNNQPTRSDQFGANGYSALCSRCSSAAKDQNWVFIGTY